MHDTAFELGSLFFDSYCSKDGADLILDVGAMNVNGTLRDCAPPASLYLGVDVSPGAGVDIVLKDSYSLPFSGEYFDHVISTSCLEHDSMFWLTFLEMLRVIRQGGYVYMNCPSNGVYHSYPVDNWRFYPDCGLALVEWGRYNGYPVTLVESFVARRKNDHWNDFVGVFVRGSDKDIRATRLISDTYDGCFNVRSFRSEGVSNVSHQTEDMILLEKWKNTTSSRPTETPDTGDRGQDVGSRPETATDLSTRFGADERHLATLNERLQALTAAVQIVQHRAADLTG